MRLLRLLPRLLVVALLLDTVWRTVTKAHAYLASPWSRDYGEGCVLAMVQLLDLRGTYYPSLQGYPIFIGNYPPLVPLLLWPFYRWFGPSIFAPRVLALLALGALVVALAALAWKLLGDAAMATAFAVLALAPWFVQSWVGLGRVDTLACALSLLGLWLWVRGGTRGARFIALPVFWLAFFAKQSAVLAPLALLLDLAWERDRRREALRAALAYLMPLGALVGLLVVATHGLAYRHLVTWTAAAQYEWVRMFELVLQFVGAAWPLLLIVLLALAVAREPLVAAGGRPVALYLGLNLLAVTTIAKEGAAQNYLIEPFLAALLAGAVALRALTARFPAFAPWRVAVVLTVALAAVFSNRQLDRLPQAIRAPERARDMLALDRIVKATAGPILSENLTVLVQNRRPVEVEPFGFALLVETGKLRPDLVVRDCEAGRFALVIAEHRVWQVPSLAECLERRYMPMEDLGPYQVLRPRPRSGADASRAGEQPSPQGGGSER